MRTSGLFTTHTYEIKLKSCNDDIFIVPFSDIHFGADGFCGDTWKEFAAWGGAHPNAWYIGNGDYIDCFRSSMQKHIKDKLDVEELKYIDRPADEMLGRFRRKLDFMEDRIIGLGDGNHGWRFQDGRNETQVLCHDLGVEYLGVLAAIRITINYQGTLASIMYVQHHGNRSGARTAGGKFNAVEWMSRSYDADILATGDDHRKGITQGATRVRFTNARKGGGIIPVEYTPLLVRTGGFLRALLPGKPNYVVDRNLGPLALGVNAIRTKLVRRMVDGKKTVRIKLGAYDII